MIKLKFIHFTVQNCFVVHIDESVCYSFFILFFFEVRGKMMLNVFILTIIDTSLSPHNVYRATEYPKPFPANIIALVLLSILLLYRSIFQRRTCSSLELWLSQKYRKCIHKLMCDPLESIQLLLLLLVVT